MVSEVGNLSDKPATGDAGCGAVGTMGDHGQPGSLGQGGVRS